MTRLSYDQEAWNRGLRDMPLSDEAHEQISADLRQRLIQLLERGQNVVLDFSFWSRSMREEWRRLVAEYGVVAETIYMATDKQTCLNRLRARARAHEDDFIITRSIATEYFDHFEPPSDDEGPLTVQR